jgi:ubiquinone/menaquinone biosynthesis C-methylase UbiE
LEKDYFSRQSQAYAAFRPTYPEELYQFIFKHLKRKSTAWDCATGNGQVARYLASHFDSVYATDISRQQLAHAPPSEKIVYSVCPAERTSFENQQFDLITVAQALHWFKLDEFYKEVKRTSRPGGLLAVWGYALLTVEPAIDELFMDFYKVKIGPYWDPARRLVENHYRDVPFPFEEINSPRFNIVLRWTAEEFGGYLNSWSATQKYISKEGENPVNAFMETLRPLWKQNEVKAVTFPLFMKLGRTDNL